MRSTEAKAAEKVARAEERAAAKAAAAEAKAAAAAAAEAAAAEAEQEVPTIEYTPEVEEPLTYTGEAPSIEVETAPKAETESEEDTMMMM